jgi:predicted dehydrogenase
VAVVDPEPWRCSRPGGLEALSIPVFPSLDEFFRTGRADLAVIAAPIHFHEQQTRLALSCGSHVLCVKPAAATVQEVGAMMAARDKAGKQVAVGYQWSFTNCIRALKSDIRAGLHGEPRRFKSLCLWPRDAAYYERNAWAGRVRDASGRWVLDSPVNNAMAHFLHNMLYCLGDDVDRSARPARIIAETYRANPIENYDTAALRIETDRGVEILFYGSHAVPEDRGPVFTFEFEGGVIEHDGGLAPITARFQDGQKKEYGSPEGEDHFKKLWTCAAAAQWEEAFIPCGLEAARAHTVCVNGAQESAGEPSDLPSGLFRETGAGDGRLRWVDGLDAALAESYEKALLPSELGTDWARPGKKVDLDGYNRFPRKGSK